MKKLLIGLLTLTSISAFAGTYGLPDQDPIVKILREKYSTAKQPTIAQLQIGKSWDCKGFNSFKDNFSNFGSQNMLKFAQYDGLILNESSGAHADYMAFTGSELAGLRTTDRGSFYIRAATDGDLIIENTSKTGVTKSNGVASISNGSLYVYSYLICPVSKIH